MAVLSGSAASPDAALLLQMLQRSREGMLLCDAQGYVRWCNAAAAAWLEPSCSATQHPPYEHCDAILAKLQARHSWAELCAAYKQHAVSEPELPLQLCWPSLAKKGQPKGQPVFAASFSALEHHDSPYAYLLALQDIHEQVLAEQALSESEKRFHSLFKASPVSIMLHDPNDGRVIDANPQAWRSYGLSSLEQLQNFNLWQRPAELSETPPSPDNSAATPEHLPHDKEHNKESTAQESRNYNYAAYGASDSADDEGDAKDYSPARALQAIQAAEQQGAQRLLWRSYTASGQAFWEDVRLNTVWLEGQQVVMATSVDVSALKASQNRLREEKQRMEDILAGTHVGTWEWHIPSGAVTFNQTWADIVGYSLEELAPISIHTWQRLTHPEDLARSNALLEAHFSGQSPLYSCEARMRHKKGHWVWVHDRGRVARWTNDGQPLLMSGTHQDISRRKEAEIALRASETKYRLAQHATGVGIWDWDVAADRIHWDSHCWRMLGYPAADSASDAAMPAPLSFADWRALLHPDDAAYTEARVWTQLASGDTFIQEFRYRRADGSWHWVQGRGQVVAKDPQGQPLRMLGTHTDIVLRKQAELALSDSEARFRQLFELYPDALMLLDPHTAKPLYYNQAAYSQLGYDADTFATMTPRDWDAIETAQEAQQRLERLRQGSLEDFETLHRHRNGQHIPVRVRAKRLELSQQAYLLVIIRDISVLKASEQRAQDLAQRLRKLAKQLPGLIYQYQQWPDGRACFPYCSEGIKHIYGCSPEEVRYDASVVFRRLHPEDAARTRDSVLQSAQSLQLWLEQYRVQHPDGHTLWVEGQAMPEPQEDGSVLWHGYIADISDRKRAEAALQESELRFRQFADSIDVVFWIRTAERMLYINPAYEQIWGRSRESLYTQPNAFIEAVHPEDRDRVLAAMQHEHQHGGHFDQSYRILHPTRGVRWIHAHSHAVPSTSSTSATSADISPEKPRFVGIATDISERLAAEASLQQQREALARSNAELEHFAYAVSHDLRQPLRMISSYITLLQRRLPLEGDADNLQMMAFVQDGAKRMEQMLLSLLEYSRVGRKGEPKASMESLEALQEALHFLSPRIAETAAEIHYQAPWPRIWASRDEFTRLLQNLINNALTYHKAEQAPVIRLHVRAEEQPQGKYWLFSVADEGIGIDSSQIPRLFKIFQRLHSRQDYEGSGVGLAMCRKIVEHHEGDIWVESAGLGKGSCFFFRLPRHDAEH